MQFQDAVLRAVEIQRLQAEHSATAERAAAMYGAHVTLFNVAAGTQDATLMDTYRLAVHADVDMLLDSGAMIGKLQAEMVSLGAQIDASGN
jgi:hypothetical protein